MGAFHFIGDHCSFDHSNTVVLPTGSGEYGGYDQEMVCHTMSLQFDLINVRDHNETTSVIECQTSVVSIFVIPDLLLLATYFYGIYLFWSGHEYLLNLAGQVGVAAGAVALL